jgi:hypothetical protein
MIGKSAPSIGKKVAGGQLGRHPGANEGVDDHQICVRVSQLCNAAAAVGAAHFDPTAGGKRQVPAHKSGEFDVRLEHDLGRGRSGRRQVPRQSHTRAAHVDYPYPPPPLGQAIDDVGQPLHVVEFQPQWIVEVDV